MKNAFCKRDLKPVFALLVALIAATIVWAIVSKARESNRVGQSPTTLAYAAYAAAPAAKAGRAKGASAGGARHSRFGDGARRVNRHASGA